MKKKKPAGRAGFTYVFDLSRRAQGVVLATRVAEPSPALAADWRCTAADDADAVSQALEAAEHEWPPLPNRKFNDFIIRFAAPEVPGKPKPR